MSISYVTGNENKLREVQKVFPKHIRLEMVKINLDELQTLDRHELVQHKLQEAYRRLRRPIIVEDVSAELANLNGLPGTFVKFFEQKLGQDALYQLSSEGEKVRIICTMGYYDGNKKIIVEGVVDGRIAAPRGSGGFGFDPVIVPDGYDKTFAELGDAKKNTISHRYRAAVLMAAQLENLL